MHQVMQFHNGIEESLLLTIERDSSLLSAADVIEAVDHFCYSRHWMMHIGPVKGKILDDVVTQKQENHDLPLFCLELGSYCGYSTVRIASQFANSGSVVYSVEREASCCAWTRRLCEKAGLSSRVKVLEGCVEAGIEALLKEGVLIDILFIDHDKAQYLQDLQLLESSGLLKKGAVVVADNILSFGIPLANYLEHVRLPVEQGGRYSTSQLHRRAVEYSSSSDCVEAGSQLEDGIEVSFLA